MNVRDEVAGSWAKLRTAWCAAASAEVVLMVMSCFKSLIERLRGSVGGLGVNFAAVSRCQRASFMKGYFGSENDFMSRRTVIDDDAWGAESRLDLSEDGGYRIGVREVSLDDELAF